MRSNWVNSSFKGVNCWSLARVESKICNQQRLSVLPKKRSISMKEKNKSDSWFEHFVIHNKCMPRRTSVITIKSQKVEWIPASITHELIFGLCYGSINQHNDPPTPFWVDSRCLPCLYLESLPWYHAACRHLQQLIGRIRGNLLTNIMNIPILLWSSCPIPRLWNKEIEGVEFIFVCHRATVTVVVWSN